MTENSQSTSDARTSASSPPKRATQEAAQVQARDTLDDTQGRAASLDSVATTTPKIPPEEKAARGIPIPETSHSKDTQPLPIMSPKKEAEQPAGTIPETYFLMNPEHEAIVQGESRTLPPLESRFVMLVGLPLVVIALGLIYYTVMRWGAIIPAVRAGANTPPDTLLNGLLWTLGTFIFGVFVLGMYVSELSRIRKRRTLEKRGGIVWGEVVTAIGKRERSGDLRITVEYQFEQPDRRRKRTLNGQVTERRNDLKDKVLPVPGTPVAVLYLNPTNYELL